MPWSREDLTRLVELEAQQRDIDPRLAVALVEQESNFDPAARSPKGAIGLLQLMPKTAAGLKVDPYDVPQNISGGLDYLKQQLDAFGGDRAQALAAYNAGPMAVKAHRGVPPYKETQRYVSRILGKLGPARAEAGTLSATDTSRLAELEAAQAQSEPAAAPDDATHAADTMARLRASQAGAAGLQPPPGDMSALAVGGGPSQQAQPVTDPLALLAMGGGLPGRAEGPGRERQILAEAGARHQRGEMKTDPAWRGVPPEAPLEESITAPSTMIPLLMPGAGVKAVAPYVEKAGPLIARGARAAAEGLSQTAGWTTGRTGETGNVPSAGEIGTEAAFNVAAGGILEGLGAAGQRILARSQAGKAIVAADEATTAARQEFAQAKATAQTELQAGRTEAYQAAERRARAAQAQYQAKVQARDATIAANQHEYQQAVAAQQHEYQQAVSAHRAKVQGEQASRYTEARTGAMEETAAARAGQQQYQQAVTGQQQAITQSRAVPGRYKPETPSWVLYEKYGDAAKDTVMDLTPAKTAVAELRAQRGVLPDGTMRPFPKAVEDIAANLEKATGPVPFETIRQEIRKLGPLTRHGDGNIRGPAKQLTGVLLDVLETAPGANDLLKNANATFRKEMAVQDMADWLKPGGGIVGRDLYNRETINVKKLFEKLDKTIANDSLFRGSFTPDELLALQRDIGQVAGTRPMPGQGTTPRSATPELLPGAAPNVPATMQQAPTPPAALSPKDVPTEVARPRQELLPGAAPGRRGTDAQRQTLASEPPAPTTPREALGERPKVFKDLTKTAMQEYMGSLFGVKPLLITSGKLLWRGGQQLRYGLARGLLSDTGRPALLRAMADSPTISPRLHGAMINALSDAERKALLRETREAREKRR